MTDIAKIADGLSEAQREALVGACMTHPNVGGEPFVTVKFTDPWPEGVAQFLTITTDKLTKTGLAVRQHIIERQS